MKKLIIGLVAALSLYGGSAQAVIVDVVSGFSSTDNYLVQSNASHTNATLNGVTGPDLVGDGQSLSSSDTDGSLFQHIYAFTAIADTFFAVSAVTEVSLGDNAIADFVMQGFQVTGGPTFTPLTAITPIVEIVPGISGATLGFFMTAGLNYAIALAGDVAGSNTPDYSLEVSVVPVPAAVWLFGTAMFGLFGLRRKQKMQAAAA